MRKNSRRFTLVCAILIAFSGLEIKAQDPAPTAKLPEQSSGLPVGVEIEMSSLGPGAEVGLGLPHRFDLRVGGNIFDDTLQDSSEGVRYTGTLRLQSLQTHLDWFPWGGNFHMGPGFLYFMKQPLAANLTMPGGVGFTLGSTNFTSNPNDPTHGTAYVHIHKTAPEITAGWGNIAGRHAGKRWSFPFEIGAAFLGTPRFGMALEGSACINRPCYDDQTSPQVLGPTAQEIAKRQRQINAYKVYPVLTGGLAYRF